MKRERVTLWIALSLFGLTAEAWSQGGDKSVTVPFAGTAQEIVAASGIKGGLVV
ncbi:MAG: hypothetical protein JRJ69_12310, partial [Deltaproteobacteria bacterium]|nr:hypothetical protein [Deltaproteobacteria bacterium]